MAFQLTLQLKTTANPHLYVNQIKELMKDDTYIHPLMKNTLLLLKKTRMPFLRLATKKDIVFIPEEYTHLERAIEPSLTDYSRVKWSSEEIEEYNSNPRDFFENILGLYVKLGYELVERIEITDKVRDSLLELTKKQAEAQENIKEKK